MDDRLHELPEDFTPPDGWVHMMSPYGSPFDGTGGVMDSSNADIVFWLQLKATTGCISRRNPRTDVMHLWIEPSSEAAKLFVTRMRAKYRALPAGASGMTQQVSEQIAKLLPP